MELKKKNKQVNEYDIRFTMDYRYAHYGQLSILH